jgi:putative SOS response-associated peptidase YedK
MCGRATLVVDVEEIAAIFETAPIEIGPPRFNIAPTQPILTVRPPRREEAPAGETASLTAAGSPERELALLRWGLIPWWAKADEAKKIASRCIQARAETVPKSSAFRDAFRRHRCLVVVDGFFEWKTLEDGRRVPFHIRGRERKPFAIAGVWDSWRPPTPDAKPGESPAERPERIQSCAVLTTRSGGVLRDLHDRMPLVLPANDWNTWLDGTPEEAARLLSQEPDVLDAHAEGLLALPVSTWVNDVKHDDPRCIEPASLDDAPPKGQLDLGLAAKAKPKATARRRAKRS